MAGIAETLEIKIESLKESISTFSKDGNQLLRAFSTEKIDISDECRLAANEYVRAEWQKSPPAGQAALASFFKHCQEGEAFAAIRTGYEKHVAAYTAKIEKSSARFKKEILLYEVCTYEEILTHSVSRLRDYVKSCTDAAELGELSSVEQAVTWLDETFASLENLLKKNNITVIHPLPHESFNGREHEVLAAEKHEGFSKGEIIKLITSGYKQKDQVILRANVIAAR